MEKRTENYHISNTIHFKDTLITSVANQQLVFGPWTTRTVALFQTKMSAGVRN
jgi:hypothetical protein